MPEWLVDVLPSVATGVGGIVIGVLATISRIRTIAECAKDARELTAATLKKYRDDEKIKKDLLALLIRYDLLLEEIAALAKRVGLVKISRLLSDMIQVEGRDV